MKACVVTNFPFYSGTGKVPFNIWHKLRDGGICDADLFLTHYLSESEKSLGGNRGVKVLHPFTYDRSPILSRLMIYFADPFLLPKGYDVYHFGNHMIARFAQFRSPSVITVHDVLQFRYPEKFESSLSSKIYNYFMEASIKNLPRANRLICVSNWSKGELLNIFGDIDPRKVSVVYNGLDHNIFYPRDRSRSRQKLGLPNDRTIILHLGSEIERKQVPLLLRSFKELKKKYPDALLVRHGEKKEGTKKLIDGLGLANDIVYYGYTQEEDLPYFYSAADVLVQPSSEEGFCFPVIEAMACGTPVAASNKASLPEVCGGAEALQICELSEGSVVSALDKVLSLPLEERQAVVERGIKNADRFSWEKTASQVYRVYQSIVEGDMK